MIEYIDIWTAFIAGFFSIISPVIVHFIKLRWHQRNLSSKRASRIRGDWKGSLTQFIENYNKLIEIPVSIHFDVSGKTIYAEIITVSDDFSANLKGQGNFPHDDFFVVNYSNTDKKRKQFGTFVGRLLPSGNEIIGKFSGYGYLHDGLVSGDLKIVRAN